MAKGELTTAGQFTQDDIPGMLEKVTAQLAALTKTTNESKPTTGVCLSGFGKIEDIHDVQTLIKALGSVSGKEKSFKDTVKAEKFTFALKPLLLDGFTPDEWRISIKDRINAVINKVQIENLQNIKTTLEANLSAKDKLAKDLENISKNMEEISF